MRNLKMTKIALIAVIALGGLYLISPKYLTNTLVHQYPDIDDYEIFDNRTVISGTPEPWNEISGARARELAPSYNDKLTEYETVAYLVIQNETILFEKYWGEYSPESLSSGFSMTKSIIGLLVGIAIDNGSIKSVDQAVGDFIPKFKEGDLSKVTIRHLLEMSSGLDWTDSYWSPFSVTVKSYYGDNLKELAIDQELEKEPGKDYEYKNGNTQLLALILEKATGLSVSAYTSLRLWKPMGASKDALWSLDKVNGTEKAFAGFNSNARDFAKFGQLILNKGTWNGKQLISSEYLENSLTPAIHLIDKHGSNVDYYGWQWWIHKYNGMAVYSMRGLKGQYVLVIPDKNMIIVRLGHKTSKEMIDNILPSDVPGYIEIGLEIVGK